MAQAKDDVPPHRDKPAPQDNKKLSETVREIFNSTPGPMQCRGQNEFKELGFTYTPTPFASGYYTNFYHAKKGEEHLILKTLELNKLKSASKKQTLEESGKILEYVAKKESVPNVVRVFGHFLVGDTLFVFMRNYSERSVHHKMRVVARFKQPHVHRWVRQLGSVCRYVQEKAIVHRSMRLEHLLLDDQENIHLTGWTRAIFVLNPVTSQLNMCNQEYRCRKRNHLPPECFSGIKHSPALIDHWSFGVLIVALSAGRYPFKPKLLNGSNFEQQWKEFLLKHGSLLGSSARATLSKLFLMQESDRTSLDELLKIDYLAEAKEANAQNSAASTTPPSKSTVKEVTLSSPGRIHQKRTPSRKVPKFEAIPMNTTKVKSVKSKKPSSSKSTSPNMSTNSKSTTESASGTNKSTVSDKSESKARTAFTPIQPAGQFAGAKAKQESTAEKSGKMTNEGVPHSSEAVITTATEAKAPTATKQAPTVPPSSIQNQATRPSPGTSTDLTKSSNSDDKSWNLNITKPSNDGKPSGN